MLGAVCIKAYSLLCMLYLHMIVYTLIQWIQYCCSIHLPIRSFVRCISRFVDSKGQDEGVGQCDHMVDTALHLSRVRNPL